MATAKQSDDDEITILHWYDWHGIGVQREGKDANEDIGCFASIWNRMLA